MVKVLPTMFYPDLEENSSRGIKSGAISKYQ